MTSGVAIKKKHFQYEACEEFGLSRSNVRLLSRDGVRDMHKYTHLLSSSHRCLLPLTRSLSHTLQQVTDDDIAPLCANLGRFKRLKTIYLVSWGVCERGAGRAEGQSVAVVECVTRCFGRDG